MKPFARGQRSRLDALTPSLDLTAGLKIAAPGMVIDFSCFGLDEDGRLSDDRFFVFYNQPSAPANAIEKLGPQNGDDEAFRVRLENLPPTIRRLVFTATIDGVGTMSQIQGGHLRLTDPSGGEVMRYEFAGRDFAGESALMLGELYWKDAWRVWAVGQGFAGNLSALLKHFGGEEDTSAPAAPSSSATSFAAPPPPPPPPPAATSVPIVGSGALNQPSLQVLVDETPTGGVLQLGPGEFRGPIAIRRAITIQGSTQGGAAGGVIWAVSGPVVTVEAPNVSLRDVEIEVTGEEGGEAEVALLARPGTSPLLHNVRVRGRVSGAGEDGPHGGKWKLPSSLDLGVLAPRAANGFEVEVEVPVACAISCTVAGTSVEPAHLEAGAHRIRLWAREVPPESFLCGVIEVRAGAIVRAIPLSGRAGAPGTEPVKGRLLT